MCLLAKTCYGGAIRWVDPSYIAIYHVLSNPAYAGAYAYGKSRREVSLDVTGARKKRVRKLPRSQWSVFIPNHHGRLHRHGHIRGQSHPDHRQYASGQ
jgi:Recombinase